MSMKRPSDHNFHLAAFTLAAMTMLLKLLLKQLYQQLHKLHLYNHFAACGCCKLCYTLRR